jgi:hypothetical protein
MTLGSGAAAGLTLRVGSACPELRMRADVSMTPRLSHERSDTGHAHVRLPPEFWG